MNNYEQLIEKIQALRDNSCCCDRKISQVEWAIIEEALTTIQFLEVIFKARTETQKKDHE